MATPYLTFNDVGPEYRTGYDLAQAGGQYDVNELIRRSLAAAENERAGLQKTAEEFRHLGTKQAAFKKYLSEKGMRGRRRRRGQVVGAIAGTISNLIPWIGPAISPYVARFGTEAGSRGEEGADPSMGIGLAQLGGQGVNWWNRQKAINEANRLYNPGTSIQ